MVEGGGLENRFPTCRDGGSNPSPSATYESDSAKRGFGLRPARLGESLPLRHAKEEQELKGRMPDDSSREEPPEASIPAHE